MSVLQIVMICAATGLACAFLRATRPELAMGVALAGGIAALFALREDLAEALALLRALIAGSGMAGSRATLPLRALGVSLVSEFGAGLCRDAGESALAGRIELGTRVVLLAMAAPLARDLLALIGEFCR